MRAHLLPGVLVFSLIVGAFPAASPEQEQAALSKLTGEELARRLPQEESRLPVYYELWRRAQPQRDDGIEAFEEHHYHPNVIVCPQPEGQPPLYLILHGFLGGFDLEAEVKAPAKPLTFAESLVPAKAQDAIEVFTSDARIIDPFGGNNVLDGVILDLNADGLIDRAEITNYVIDGVDHAQVLSIATVKPQPEPLLDLLLNWDDDEWTWRLTDPDGDGIADVEAGPRTAKGMITKATWKWDAASHSYLGPKGGPGDHFRVLDGTKLWPELQRLQTAKLHLPHDLDGIAESDLPSPAGAVLAEEPPLQEVPQEPKVDLPQDFWTADPKTSALAFLNGDSQHFHYAPEEGRPPERCSIALEVAHAGCFGSSDGQFFLRVDPRESYLVFGASQPGGETTRLPLDDRPVYDLRLCPVPYADARKVADALWWLDRARARRRSRDPILFSTETGKGRLTFRAGGGVVFQRIDSAWSMFAEDRQRSPQSHQVVLNCSAYLLTHVLPERLGEAWPQQPAPNSKDLRALAERLLGWYSLAQEKISFALVADAAELVGASGSRSAQKQLQAIAQALPPAGVPPRTFEQITADQSQLLMIEQIEDRATRKAAMDRSRALEEEMQATLYDPQTGSADRLRTVTTVAMRQLASADRAEQLYPWATSREAGAAWALQRLAQIDRARYVEALVAWTRLAEGSGAREFFEKLAETDPARATARAWEEPAEQRSALTISAFLHLRADGPVPDEAKRLATITQILHDPRSNYEERGRAIDALVPPEAPQRYPGPEIDAALLKLFEPAQADESVNFTLPRACRALALRGCTGAFDGMAEQLAATGDTYVFDGVLGALTQLTQRDPAKFQPRLQALLQPHLTTTSMHVVPILWAIWAADLRTLQPELERLATRDADDTEDPRVNDFGGQPGLIIGRFHLARKIVELWRESDLLACGRALADFALAESNDLIRDPVPERAARFQDALRSVAQKLTPAEKKELAAWLDNLDAHPPKVGKEPIAGEVCQKVTAAARSGFQL